MNRKRRYCKWLVVTLLFLAVVCMTVTGFAQTPKRGGWLKVATDDTAIGLDPHLSLTNSTFTFTEHVYDTLLRFNYKGQLEPSLAVSWKQPNPTTYIFNLRKGVKFHNGREMTADDVVYSFKRILDPKTGSPSASTFEVIKSDRSGGQVHGEVRPVEDDAGIPELLRICSQFGHRSQGGGGEAGDAAEGYDRNRALSN